MPLFSVQKQKPPHLLLLGGGVAVPVRLVVRAREIVLLLGPLEVAENGVGFGAGHAGAGCAPEEQGMGA